MDAETKLKELTERVEFLESVVDVQSQIVEKCFDLLAQTIETQTKLVKAVGYKRVRTKKGAV